MWETVFEQGFMLVENLINVCVKDYVHNKFIKTWSCLVINILRYWIEFYKIYGHQDKWNYNKGQNSKVDNIK